MQRDHTQPGARPTAVPQPRSLGEVAAEIGHDLNNLVGVVGGRSELALLQLERGRTAEAQRGLEVICSQLPRLHLLAERLRGLRESGREQGGVDVREIAERAATRGAAGGGVGVRNEGSEKLPLAFADPQLLAEALGESLRLAQERPGEQGAAPSPVSVVLRTTAESVELELAVPGCEQALCRRMLGEAARILAPTRAVVQCDLASEHCKVVIRLPAASASAPILDPAEASG